MLNYKMIDEMSADELFAIERKGVGAGWQPIIEKCHNTLRDACPYYKPVQIKEKFGELRFYVQGVESRSPAYAAITEAENASSVTCEECGEPGTVQSIFGWFRCLCPKDFDTALERRKQDRAALRASES